MRVVIFFLYLCAFLLKGSGYSYAVTHEGNIAHTLPASSGKGPGHTVAKDAATANDCDYLINDDNDQEDEDSDNTPVAEQALLPHCYASLPYCSIFIYLCKSSKAPPFTGQQASHIYILQRTLRI